MKLREKIIQQQRRVNLGAQVATGTKSQNRKRIRDFNQLCLLIMVGVKRPARETDRSSTKKLKVQDSSKSHPKPPDPTPPKKVSAQSPDPESASEGTSSDSNLSAEESGEDLKENTWGARSNGSAKRPQTDEGDVNDTLNGPYPLATHPFSGLSLD
jgi:hypothetical protein